MCGKNMASIVKSYNDNETYRLKMNYKRKVNGINNQMWL